MSEERLPTGVWVDAHLRHLTEQGIPFYIINKGPQSSGIVMLKLNGLGNGCLLIQQQRDIDGILGWMSCFKEETVEEKKADDYIQRAIDRDTDLWVIEIEDPAMNNPFEGNIF